MALSLTSRQPGQMNLGYLPTSLWLRGLSLPRVSINKSGFCPLPFSFSFLLKLSALTFTGQKSLNNSSVPGLCLLCCSLQSECHYCSEKQRKNWSSQGFGCQALQSCKSASGNTSIIQAINKEARQWAS